MRIALVKRSFSSKGGLEKQAVRLAAALSERGCTVTCVASVSDPSEYDVILGIDRTLCQTHHRAGNGVHAAYLHARGRPLSALMPRHCRTLKLEKSMLTSPTLRHIITNSDMVKGEFVRLYNCDPKKITTIHNGVEWHELEQPFSESQKDGTFHFLFVGQDFRRKGLKELLYAAAELPCQVSVVGTDRYMASYQKLARRLGLDGRITFAGHADPRPYYKRAHALVLPTLYDPFANVTVEALAMGLPVITTPTNGGSEILTATNGIVTTDFLPAMQKAMQLSWDPQTIRNSVQHLDFSNQMAKYAEVLTKT